MAPSALTRGGKIASLLVSMHLRHSYYLPSRCWVPGYSQHCPHHHGCGLAHGPSKRTSHCHACNQSAAVIVDGLPPMKQGLPSERAFAKRTARVLGPGADHHRSVQVLISCFWLSEAVAAKRSLRAHQPAHYASVMAPVFPGCPWLRVYATPS